MSSVANDDARWFDRMEAAFDAVATDASVWPESPDDPIPYELSALFRLETTVHESGFIHFIGMWGEPSYRFALQALSRMKADATRAILEKQYALVAPALADPEFKQGEDLFRLLDGETRESISALDEALWELPDDTVALGLATYGG